MLARREFEAATAPGGNDLRSGAPQEDQEDRKTGVLANGSGQPPAMLAWLAAKAGGLAVQFDLPNVAQACAAAVVIPSSVLSDAGADPQLLSKP